MSRMVSVVIPCRNEVRAIEATVRAILEQDYPEIEVLVVDGRSEDGTRDVLARLEREDSRVRMIDNPHKLTPYAFNLGVKNARGGFVQIVGSRNVMARDYLSLLVQELGKDPSVACVGGDYQHVSDSEAGRLISRAMESRFGVGGGNYRTMTGDRDVDTVGVPMYRANIFHEVGYFDENLTRNQDDDFNFRVTQKGHRIRYVHAAKVTYLVRGSFKKAFQQFSQYGYFKVFVNKKHGAVTTWRQVVPAAFLAFWVMGLPGMLLAGQGLGFVDRLYVLATCFVLHVGYGYGYWKGIWDFLIQRRDPSANFQKQTT
ncbi:MAG TPA: glycosyltransferase family 2 protein [Bdellovibrionales bacterium]|nr:glycosyltransferase family 2 protein [Bdellovibrionales bacterium]